MKTRPTVETIAEARRLFEEHRAYCRKHIFKYPKVPADTIKYYFHWYRWTLHDGQAKNFDDFLKKIVVHKELANGKFNFILYSYPFIGKKMKRSDEITIQVTTLILENIEQAKLLFEQEEISMEDILHFLENKTIRMKIESVETFELEEYRDKNESSDKWQQYHNCTFYMVQGNVITGNSIKETNIERIETDKSKNIVKTNSRIINHNAPIADTTLAPNNDASIPKPGMKKGKIQIEKITIEPKLFNALKDAGYIERSEEKYDGKKKYKWIKKCSKNKQITNRQSLFDFCDLMGYFKGVDRVQFINANFEFKTPIKSSDFGGYDKNKKSEFYYDLSELVNKHKNT